jgi:hypothetical protein
VKYTEESLHKQQENNPRETGVNIHTEIKEKVNPV